MSSTSAYELWAILPEGLVVTTALLVIVADILFSSSKSSSNNVPVLVTFFGILAALCAVVVTWNDSFGFVIEKNLLVDPVSQFLKGVVLLCGCVTVPMVGATKEIRGESRGEFCALLLLMLFSSMIMASSQNLLATYVSIQMSVLASSLLIAFRMRPKSSSEAGLKHFVHSQIVSVVFLFGIVLLYFHSNSLYLSDIRAQLIARDAVPSFAIVSFSFILIAPLVLGWIFPFQMLAPDSTQGAPISLSAFVLAVPLVGALALILKLCAQLFGENAGLAWNATQGVPWDTVFSVLSAVTITVGTLGSLVQNNVKRFLAYCAVAQVGYLILGFAVLDRGALVAILSGLLSFCVALLGIFGVAHRVIGASAEESIDAFRGLVWRDSLIGVAACIFLLSLSGMPPFAGFSSRFELLGAVVRGKLYWLSGLVVLNWVIGVIAYGRLIKEIFYPVRQAEVLGGPSNSAKFVVVAMLLPTTVLGIAWNSLHEALARSIDKISW